MTFPLVLLILDAYPLAPSRARPRAVAREKLHRSRSSPSLGRRRRASRRSVQCPRCARSPITASRARVAQAASGSASTSSRRWCRSGLHPARLLLGDTSTRRRLATCRHARGRRDHDGRRRSCGRRWPWLLATWARLRRDRRARARLRADRAAAGRRPLHVPRAACPWTALLAARPAPRRGVRARPAASSPGTTLVILDALGALTFRADPRSGATRSHSGITRSARSRATASRSPTAALRPQDRVAPPIADYPRRSAATRATTSPYFNRGNARGTTRGDFAGAVADHSTVIALRPTDPNAYEQSRLGAAGAGGLRRGAAADYAAGARRSRPPTGGPGRW